MRIKFVIFGLSALAAVSTFIAVVSWNQMSISDSQVPLLMERIYVQDGVIYDLKDNNARLKLKIDKLHDTIKDQDTKMSRLSERIDNLENPPKRKKK